MASGVLAPEVSALLAAHAEKPAGELKALLCERFGMSQGQAKVTVNRFRQGSAGTAAEPAGSAAGSAALARAEASVSVPSQAEVKQVERLAEKPPRTWRQFVAGQGDAPCECRQGYRAGERRRPDFPESEGYGLFATRDIGMYELVFAEIPVFDEAVLEKKMKISGVQLEEGPAAPEEQRMCDVMVNPALGKQHQTSPTLFGLLGVDPKRFHHIRLVATL